MPSFPVPKKNITAESELFPRKMADKSGVGKSMTKKLSSRAKNVISAENLMTRLKSYFPEMTEKIKEVIKGSEKQKSGEERLMGRKKVSFKKGRDKVIGEESLDVSGIDVINKVTDDFLEMDDEMANLLKFNK